VNELVGPRNRRLGFFVLAAERALGGSAGEEFNRGQRLGAIKFFVHFITKFKFLILAPSS
jgi:hypothetical protein